MSIANIIKDYFAAEDWKYEAVRDNIFRCGVNARESTYTLFFDAREEQDQIQILTVLRTNVPEKSVWKSRSF